MPNPIDYTTWHTSRIPQLVYKEPSLFHHPCSHSSSILSWIKWHFDGFAILHAKVLENFFEMPNLADVKKMLCTIPFHFHAKEEMQIAKIFHFEFLKNFFLHFQKLVLIIAHQDEIINVDHNEKSEIFDLCNIHVKVRITYKFNVLKKNI
jgi:hypothetical protein